MPESTEAQTLLSDYYLQTHQVARGVATFAALSGQHAKNVPMQVEYARLLLSSNDIPKASAILKELNKEHSQSTQVEIMNATLLLHEGKIDDAYSTLEKATKNAPDSVPLQILLAQTAAMKGDMSTSETSFREAARMDPANLAAQSGLATIASNRGDSSSLAQVADQTIKLHPDYAMAYIWRGVAEANRGQLDQAENDFQRSLKIDPNMELAYTELGQLRLHQQKTAEGQAFLMQALEKNPNAPRPLNLLIATELTAKQPAKAIASVQQMISKSPNSSALYGDLAGIQLNMKDYSAARDSAIHSIQLDAQNEQAVQALSQAYAGLGQVDQAVDLWQRWLGSHPNDAKALLLLGTFEQARGDMPKAMEYYKKTLEAEPGQPVASNNLAYLMVESGGDINVALSLAQNARRSLPESSNTADTLAWVYYRAGTFASARDLLEEAAKKSPDDASVHYHLGMTYLKLNDKSDAKVQLAKAVALAPAGQVGQQANSQLDLIR